MGGELVWKTVRPGQFGVGQLFERARMVGEESRVLVPYLSKLTAPE